VVQVSPSEYTVTIAGISGEGTLGLNLVDDDGIVDFAGAKLGGPVPGDGNFTGEVYAIDTVGPDAPSVGGDATPTNVRTPSWIWTGTPASGGVGRFRYGWSVGDWIGEDVTDEVHTPAGDLPEGAHTLHVQERDALGNWSSAGSYGIVIDLTLPDAPYVTGPTPTADTTPTWTWMSTGGGNGRFRYGHTLGTWIEEDVTTQAYAPAVPLPEGTHTLYVQERDDAGNWSPPGEKAIVVDPDCQPPQDDHTPFGGGCGPGGAGAATLLPLIALWWTTRRRWRRMRWD
jgi:hypothetical protein